MYDRRRQLQKRVSLFISITLSCVRLLATKHESKIEQSLLPCALKGGARAVGYGHVNPGINYQSSGVNYVKPYLPYLPLLRFIGCFARSFFMAKRDASTLTGKQTLCSGQTAKYLYTSINACLCRHSTSRALDAC